MGVLALKLLLAPGFVVAASLVGRRHGPRVAGIVGGFPVVGGPILLVITLQHGNAFGGRAAVAALAGLLSLAAFVATYAVAAPRMPWFAAQPLATLAFLAVTAALDATGVPGPVAGFVLSATAFAAALALLPRARPAGRGTPPPSWDLPMRAVAAAAMVLLVTGAAASLGPRLSGLLAPFPIITTVLAAFTHAQRGPQDTLRLLRGMLAGFYVYALAIFAFAAVLGRV